MKTGGKKLGIWALALALFLAHLFLRSIAYAEESSSWSRFQEGGWSIAFPAPPQKVQKSLQRSDLGQGLQYDLYLAPFEDRGVFLFLVATFSLALSEGHEKVGLEGLLKGFLGKDSENRLVFSRWDRILDVPSIHFLIQRKASDFRGQAFMIGNQLFLIAMESGKGALEEEVFSRFAQTFRFNL